MKIGIGCGVNPEKVIWSAGKSASPDVEIICYVKEGMEFVFVKEMEECLDVDIQTIIEEF